MWDRVEVFRQISVDNVGVAPADQPVRFLDCIDRAAARAIAIGAILEVRLKDRLEHDLGGGLDNPVPYRRDAKRAFSAPGLRDRRPPHRIRPIRLRNEFLTQAREPRFHARRLDLLEGYPVHARRARIVAGAFIGVKKNVLAADFVIEQIEAESGLRLRFAIELSLKGPDLVGRFKAHRQSPSPRHLRKHARSQGPSLPRNYPASTVLWPCPTPVRSAARSSVEAVTSDRTGLPRCPHHPSDVPCPIPRQTRQALASIASLSARPSRAKDGSASASTLSRPARTSLALRPVGSLSRPWRPLSRGFGPASHPAQPLVSYQINRQLSGWNLPPLVIRAIEAHFCPRRSLGGQSRRPFLSGLGALRVNDRHGRTWLFSRSVADGDIRAV